jgi:hypothetical protein
VRSRTIPATTRGPSSRLAESRGSSGSSKRPWCRPNDPFASARAGDATAPLSPSLRTPQSAGHVPGRGGCACRGDSGECGPPAAPGPLLPSSFEVRSLLRKLLPHRDGSRPLAPPTWRPSHAGSVSHARPASRCSMRPASTPAPAETKPRLAVPAAARPAIRGMAAHVPCPEPPPPLVIPRPSTSTETPLYPVMYAGKLRVHAAGPGCQQTAQRGGRWITWSVCPIR